MKEDHINLIKSLFPFKKEIEPFYKILNEGEFELHQQEFLFFDQKIYRGFSPLEFTKEFNSLLQRLDNKFVDLLEVRDEKDFSYWKEQASFIITSRRYICKNDLVDLFRQKKKNAQDQNESFLWHKLANAMVVHDNTIHQLDSIKQKSIFDYSKFKSFFTSSEKTGEKFKAWHILAQYIKDTPILSSEEKLIPVIKYLIEESKKAEFNFVNNSQLDQCYKFIETSINYKSLSGKIELKEENKKDRKIKI